VLQSDKGGLYCSCSCVTNITRYGNIVSNAEAQQDIEFDPIEPDDDNPYIEGTEDADLGEEAWHNMNT
jgi:hypothetical protein